MFIIGQRVQWTSVSGNQRTISVRLREGTVVGIGDETIRVETSKGHYAEVPVDDLQPAGAKSALTAFVETVTQAARASAGGPNAS